jgi:hypothetical protein
MTQIRTTPTTGAHVTKENAMQLIHEQLARSHQQERLRAGAQARRVHHLAQARRWRRRAEQAGRRARLAALAIQ